MSINKETCLESNYKYQRLVPTTIAANDIKKGKTQNSNLEKSFPTVGPLSKQVVDFEIMILENSIREYNF